MLPFIFSSCPVSHHCGRTLFSQITAVFSVSYITSMWWNSFSAGCFLLHFVRQSFKLESLSLYLLISYILWQMWALLSMMGMRGFPEFIFIFVSSLGSWCLPSDGLSRVMGVCGWWWMFIHTTDAGPACSGNIHNGSHNSSNLTIAVKDNCDIGWKLYITHKHTHHFFPCQLVLTKPNNTIFILIAFLHCTPNLAFCFSFTWFKFTLPLCILEKPG